MSEHSPESDARDVMVRRLRSLLDSPLGNRCVTCGHVKHNDLGYCQNGIGTARECPCQSGTTVAGLATILLRDLPRAFPPAKGDES